MYYFIFKKNDLDSNGILNDYFLVNDLVSEILLDLLDLKRKVKYRKSRFVVVKLDEGGELRIIIF